LPNKPKGVPRIDDGQVISGIIHVIRNGLMWRGTTAACGPYKALYNRIERWSQAGVFDRTSAALAAESAATDTAMIDAGSLKAHRTAASLRKGGLFPAASGAAKAA
jgi:transposase